MCGERTALTPLWTVLASGVEHRVGNDCSRTVGRVIGEEATDNGELGQRLRAQDGHHYGDELFGRRVDEVAG